MSQIAKFTFVPFLGLFLLVSSGCNQQGLDPQKVAMYRTSMTLADEPEELQTVSEVRLALLGEQAASHDHGDHEDHEGHEDEHAGETPEEHAAHANHDEHDEHAGETPEEHAAHADHEDHAGETAEEHAAHAEDHDHAHEEGEGHEHVHAAAPIDVAVVGHIGGLPNPWKEAQPEYPFASSQAVLFLADPQAVVENEEAGHSHAPGEECAFCAAHAADQADMLAVVQFVDENGKVLPMDVRQLFDVKENDTVVISGKARVTEGGILVVDARGMYVRR